MSYTNLSQVSENFTQQTLFCHTSMTKSEKGFDSGLLTRMILNDLQKAFDTIDQNILIKKIPFLDFTDETINWHTSNISNRKFIISIENAYSDKASKPCGVPQGLWVHSSFYFISTTCHRL